MATLEATLPKAKQTVLGLYVTAKEAYEKWKAEPGFTKAYNVMDGMEGDANADSDQVAQAQPLKDGWKHSGCPWTKQLTPDRMVLPKAS